MIVSAKIEDNKRQPDFSGLTDKQQENIQSIRYLPESNEYEITFTEKYERKQIKEEAKQLKAENKALKKRITEATDYKDLKDKVSKVENSKESPTKWSHKVELLEGEYIDHKGTIYVVLQDHTASKETPPPQEELYELV